MRSLVVVLGLLLANGVQAAPCRQPSAPDIPVDAPVAARVQKKLVRDVAGFIEDSAKFVSCLRTLEAADPSTIAEKEYVTVRAVADIVDLFETRVGHSDELAEQIMKIAGPTSRSNLDRRIAEVERVYASDASQTFDVAVAHANARRFAEARAAIATLDYATLTPFDHSRAERILYAISYAQEKFEEARWHLQQALAAGGLTQAQVFSSRIALADIDVMLRLSDTAFEGVADQSGE
jgi:hypothetical protein